MLAVWGVLQNLTSVSHEYTERTGFPLHNFQLWLQAVTFDTASIFGEEIPGRTEERAVQMERHDRCCVLG